MGERQWVHCAGVLHNPQRNCGGGSLGSREGGNTASCIHSSWDYKCHYATMGWSLGHTQRNSNFRKPYSGNNDDSWNRQWRDRDSRRISFTRNNGSLWGNNYGRTRCAAVCTTATIGTRSGTYLPWSVDHILGSLLQVGGVFLGVRLIHQPLWDAVVISN